MGISELRDRIDDQRELAYELLRIFLGVGLFARGILFMLQPELLEAYLGVSADHWAVNGTVAHWVMISHLAGGLMLAGGMATRVAAAAQLPVLLGAVVGYHLGEGLMVGGLELAVLVLVMTAVFAVFGGGSLSADAHMREAMQKRMNPAPGA